MTNLIASLSSMPPLLFIGVFAVVMLGAVLLWDQTNEPE